DLWMDEQRLDAASSDYSFDFLPTRVPLVIGARDETTSAYGRMSFVHDGTDRTLELRPAFVLHGCLLAADDKSPVTSAHVLWEFRDESELKYPWSFAKCPLATDPSGCFEARGPMQIMLWERTPLDR